MWKTEEKVRKFVEKYKMISPGDRVVPFVSFERSAKEP